MKLTLIKVLWKYLLIKMNFYIFNDTKSSMKHNEEN